MVLSVSGVGVLDKAVVVLDAIETRPRNLAELVAATSLSRATAHRLATALEVHGLLRRDHDGRFALGPHALALGAAATRGWPLTEVAGPILADLRDLTGESAQLYVRDGDRRVCIASLESTHGLRTIVTAGASLPLDQGSGGRALLGDGAEGWVASVEEREPGVASVSAPVVDRVGEVAAAIGVSGPVERLSREPGAAFGPAVMAAAVQLARAAGLS